MNKLHAFVGHSFTKNDEAVVGAFLAFFTTLSGILPGFEWAHAEEAEPKILSEKVREKMEGKNLFIAICTAKERTISMDKLCAMPFLKTIYMGSAVDFQRKTSDWVTQEIAYALGKEMHLVVLLEEGVRVPGGLQGDLEYIPFNRAAPSSAFNKVLQMLKSLSPKLVGNETSMPSTKTTDKTLVAPHDELAYRQPQPTWRKDEYENALMNAVWRDNSQDQENILEAHAKSPLINSPSTSAEFRGYCICFHAVLGKKTDLGKLRALVQGFPSSAALHGYLALSLNKLAQFAEAADEFVQAAKYEPTDVDRADRLVDAAVAKRKSGDPNSESWLRDSFKNLPTDIPAIKNTLLWGLRQLADSKGDVIRWISFAEARLQASPEKYELRSDLAYKYFEQKRFPLALLHFLRIPTSERTVNDWNNMGASYVHMDVPGRAVVCYEKSREMGGTTAVSNLAYKLTEFGFFAQAETMCQSVVALPNCDKRVASALGNLASKVQTETETVDHAIDSAEHQHKFFSELGVACATLVSYPPSGEWKTPECTVLIEPSGNEFFAKGVFVRSESNGLRGMGMLSSGLAEFNTAKRIEITVTYTGKITGRSCLFTRTVIEDPATLNTFGATSHTGYLVFAADGLSISEMRQLESVDATVNRWTKTPAK